MPFKTGYEYKSESETDAEELAAITTILAEIRQIEPNEVEALVMCVIGKTPDDNPNQPVLVSFGGTGDGIADALKQLLLRVTAGK